MIIMIKILNNNEVLQITGGLSGINTVRVLGGIVLFLGGTIMTVDYCRVKTGDTKEEMRMMMLLLGESMAFAAEGISYILTGYAYNAKESECSADDA